MFERHSGLQARVRLVEQLNLTRLVEHRVLSAGVADCSAVGAKFVKPEMVQPSKAPVYLHHSSSTARPVGRKRGFEHLQVQCETPVCQSVSLAHTLHVI